MKNVIGQLNIFKTQNVSKAPVGTLAVERHIVSMPLRLLGSRLLRLRTVRPLFAALLLTPLSHDALSSFLEKKSDGEMRGRGEFCTMYR